MLAGLAWFMHDVSPTLSHQDAGRDLYTAWRMTEGDLPYRDFQWVYGPLMLFYYAACFKILGASIVSMQIGYALLQVLGSFFTFLSARALFGRLIAFPAAALHFFLSGAYHTYNHAGVVALLAILVHWFVIHRSRGTPVSGKSIGGLVAVLSGIYALKPTMGALASFGASLFVILQGIRNCPGAVPLSLRALVLLAVPALATYPPRLLLVWNQPADRWPLCNTLIPPPLKLAHSFTWNYLTIVPAAVLKGDWPSAFDRLNILYFLLLFCGAVVCAWAIPPLWRFCLRKAPAPPPARLMAPVLFFLLGHEFFLGVRNPASLGYHLGGLFSLTVAGVLDALSRSWRIRWPRTALASALLLLSAYHAARPAISLKCAGRGFLWDHPRAGVWVPDTPYGRTLAAVPEALERLTGPGERVAVLPRGLLYLFIAGRVNALWIEEINCHFLGPGSPEEERILAALPEVRVILLTNFTRYPHFPMNNMGEHYGLKIMKHVENGFSEVERVPAGPLRTFGPDRPFHFDDHQVRFLVRRPD